MNIQLFLSMSAFALAASITPGPVNLVALSSGVQHGFRASLRHVTGATVGFTLLLVVIGLGVHEILTRYPQLVVGLRYFGVAFLLYMAVQLLRDAGQMGRGGAQSLPSYWAGALMQWLNPKAWLASVAGMGAYAANGAVGLVVQFALLYFVICYASIAAWAYAGGFLSAYVHEPRHVRRFNRLMAVLLLASAAYVLWA
ncbi:MAG: LysE family translocator [Formosimonas sp.]